MEDFYFLLFVVALGAVSVLLFLRGSKSRSRKNRSRTPAGRTLGGHLLRREIPPRAPTVSRKHTGKGATRKASDPWKSTRVRAAKPSQSSTSRRQSIHASSIGTKPVYGHGKHVETDLTDQEISHAEHLGIDEYFHKVEKAKEMDAAARVADDDSAMTMTAMKYESEDEAKEKAEAERRQQTGTKP